MQVTLTQSHDAFCDESEHEPQPEDEQEDDRHNDHDDDHLRIRLIHLGQRIVHLRRRRHDTGNDRNNRMKSEACNSSADTAHDTPPAHEHQRGADVCQQQVINPVSVEEVEWVHRVAGGNQRNHRTKCTHQVDKERSRHI